MRIACTGFLSEQTGSIAGANALLLRSLLERGVEVDFFSKPSFVDPRIVAGGRPGFRFLCSVNHLSDGARAHARSVPLVNSLASRWDTVSYNSLLVKRMRKENRHRAYDLILWMGDYAWGAVPGVPTVSFVQGPPGTDARSILGRTRELRALCGPRLALKWKALARLRLSRLGLPDFRHSDYFIVGSQRSRETLRGLYGIDPSLVSVLPYPIDLTLFRPLIDESAPPKAGSLQVLWLGRIVPRKRLDLFLEGAARAIRDGADVRLTIVGRVGFIPGYEALINSFQFPERLKWLQGVPRAEVPDLIRRHDVLAQPSDEEDFGSSVAEAQACGLPVIVGLTNGNANYLCSRDIHLSDDQPETFARALEAMWERKRLNLDKDPLESRRLAEEHFSIDRVADALAGMLASVLAHSSSTRKSQLQWSPESSAVGGE